jgi:ribonuclease Z
MVNMRLVFLGTSAATPTPSRGLSSLVLSRRDELLIFDAGEGMQRNFIKAGLGINKRMKIFITHLHADHCLGLLGLLQTMSLLGREVAVDIYGHPDLAEFIKANMRLLCFGLIFDIHINIIKGEGIVVKETDYQITCCEAEHCLPAYAYCLTEFERPGIFNIDEVRRLGIPEGKLYRKLQFGEDITYNGKVIKSSEVTGPTRPGRKVGISGDTRPTNKLQDFFRNCDLLVFESTYSHDKYQKALERFHSTARQAATLAKRAGARKLVLTHFSARYNDTMPLVSEASKIHDSVEAAEDLGIIEIPYKDD